MDDDSYWDLDMGPLTLDDPETGEPLVDQETGEIQLEQLEEGVLRTCTDYDPETGEPTAPERTKKSVFKIPVSFLGGGGSLAKKLMNTFPSRGSALKVKPDDDLTHEVVVTRESSSSCPKFGKKRRRSGSLSNEATDLVNATFVNKKLAADEAVVGKFGHRFLQGKAWPKVLIVLGLFLLTPGFAIPFGLMLRLYMHYKKHFALNPSCNIDDNEVLPCGLRRREIMKYTVLHTLLHMCRVCREEFAGEKFARVHSKLHPTFTPVRPVHHHRPDLGGADHITCCG